MKIDYTIVNIINKQIETYGNRIRKVQVDLSNSDKRSVKIIGDVLYVKAIKNEYELARIVAEQINKNHKEEDWLEPSKAMERAREREDAIRHFEEPSEKEKERLERQRRIKHYKRKRDNDKKKKSERKEKREKNREKRKKAIKGFAGLAVLAPGIILGTMAASKSIEASEIDNQNDRNIIVEYGNENFESDEQIRESINGMLESEISKATGKNEDISFESEWIDSKTKKTVLNVGDTQYKYIKELDGISAGNLSGEVANLIDAARNAENTEELMNAWIRVKKFSKNKDLKIEDEKLIEVDSNDDDIER